jgi:two-component system sensor histidine kinase UhpB
VPLNPPWRARARARGELEVAGAGARWLTRPVPDPIILALASALFATVFVLRLNVDNPAEGISQLYMLPIALVGIQLGARAGLIAAGFALGLFALYASLEHVEVGPIGYLTRAAAFSMLGGLLGRFVERMLAAERSVAQQAVRLAALMDRIDPLDPGRRVTAEPSDEPRASGGSPVWRIFIPNALVLVAAGLALALSPATISSPIDTEEASVLIAGLGSIVVINLLLTRRAVRRGRGAPSPDGGQLQADTEIVALTGAFNQMLDRIETERRESAWRTLQAQEADRRRLARELHDEVGQVLTALVLHLKRVSVRVPDEVRPELHEAQETARASLEDVRRIMRELRPEALDDLGLTRALASLGTQFAGKTGIPIEVALDETLPGLEPEAELVVYRIAQESLTNAARHSGASRIELRLERDGQRLVRLRVSDDGAGLNGSATNGGGIRGMRERALAIGADLRVEQRAGGGTRVTLVADAAKESA